MKENDEMDYGQINISDEVVGTIVGITVMSIPGVAGMSGGITEDISKMLGMKNLSKGVRINVENESTSIDIYIIVDYGINIPEVALKIQENVKKELEMIAGLDISKVNINIQNVFVKKEDEINKDLLEN